MKEVCRPTGGVSDRIDKATTIIGETGFPTERIHLREEVPSLIVGKGGGITVGIPVRRQVTLRVEELFIPVGIVPFPAISCSDKEFALFALEQILARSRKKKAQKRIAALTYVMVSKNIGDQLSAR